MLGLGTSVIKGAGRASNLGIITDNLVLKHNYDTGRVHQVSTGAAFFDGTDDYIDVGDSDDIITGTNVTMACWFRLLDGDDTYLMTNKRTSGSSNLAIRVNLTSGGANDGHVSFVIWDGSSSHGDVSYDGNVDTSNKWHHVAVTTTSSAQKLYLDGVEVASGSNTFGNAASSDHMLLGNGPGSYFLKGYMCNAAVWNRVLSQAEVKSIMWKNYADLTSAETTSLSSWWNLDSTIGIMTAGDNVGGGTSFVKDNHHGGGSELGSELLDNSSLSSDTTDWTLSSLSFDSGTFTQTGGGGTNGRFYQTITTVVGKTYKVDATITSGIWWVYASTNNSSSGAIEYTEGSVADQTVPLYFTATGTTTYIICYLIHASSTTGQISNVSAKLVNGNTGTLS